MADVLKRISPDGRITFGRFNGIGKDHASKGARYACSAGILERVSMYDRIEHLDSVKFWLTQLENSGNKHTQSNNGTKELYLRALARFDEWLSGRPFLLHKTVWYDGESTSQSVTKSFGNVEEVMDCCRRPSYGSKVVQRILREYMVTPHVAESSVGACLSIRSAIRSYFAVHDVVLAMPKMRKKRQEHAQDYDEHMALEDFYKMLQNGKPGIMLRTVMLIMLQSGMDASTITD